MGELNQYPSPWEALFGNGHVANIRCGLKYIAWQLVWLVTTVIFSAAYVCYVIVSQIPRIVPTDNRVARGISGWLYRRGEWVEGWFEKYGGVLVAIWIAFCLLVIATGAILMFIANPIAFIIGVGMVIGTLVVSVIVVLLHEWLSAKNTGQKIANTPGVRRVYGNCPVSFTMKPKWTRRFYERS